MRKSVGVLVIVAALVAIVWYADSATRKHVAQVKVSDAAIAVGPPAPEMTLKDLKDQDVSLSQLKGKVVLINFWATWCEPCRDEIPDLIDLQNKYRDRGFTVLGISLDEEGKKVVIPFVETKRFDVHGKQELMNYPIVMDTDNAVQKFGGLLGYPTSILLSRDGRQVKRQTGVISYQDMDKAIQALL